jgi:DNA polymerase III delta prime subunit
MRTSSSDKLSHAVIVRGGNAESAFTRHLFAKILCSAKEGARPCLVCPHCAKALRGIHPDIAVISRLRDERGALRREISVEQIREAVLGAIIAPNEASMRVIAVEEAEKMRREAQNALLKTLEEPPAQLAIALITDAPGALLPTVRSRCRVIDSGEAPAPAQERAARLAEAYFEAAGGGAARLAEFSFELEKAERGELAPFLSEARRLAAARLRGATGNGSAALSKRAAGELLRAINDGEKYLKYNVGMIHIAARLCAAATEGESG